MLMKNEKDIFLEKLGKKITKLREQKGLSQSELAVLCEKDRQSINRLEKGNVNPSVYYLAEICKALNISLSKLFE